MLLAFIAIMFITPDSLLIRLSNVHSWNLIFYRGFIPFVVVFIGLLIIKRSKFFYSIIENGWHGIGYICTFIVTNILFVVSIENTNVANTLIMISLAPMLSALVSFIFLKEFPDRKTWVAITITTLAVIYIFIPSQIPNTFLTLQKHSDSLYPISYLNRNWITVNSSALLKISKLSYFHSIAPNFPSNTPSS